jgi:hypothetical protein
LGGLQPDPILNDLLDFVNRLHDRRRLRAIVADLFSFAFAISDSSGHHFRLDLVLRWLADQNLPWTELLIEGKLSFLNGFDLNGV